jgi:hypothetical protein
VPEKFLGYYYYKLQLYKNMSGPNTFPSKNSGGGFSVNNGMISGIWSDGSAEGGSELRAIRVNEKGELIVSGGSSGGGGSTADSTAALQTAGNNTLAQQLAVLNSTAALQTAGNTTLTQQLAVLNAIANNTAVTTQYDFELAIDNSGVFVIRHDTTTGTSNNYSLSGAAYTPVGTIRLNETSTTSPSLQTNEYKALTAGANYAIGETLTRLIVVNSNGTLNPPTWQNAAGIPIVVSPVIGTNAIDINEDQTALLNAIKALLNNINTVSSTSALQAVGNTSLAQIASAIPPLGQALTTQSLPVVLPQSQIDLLAPFDNFDYSTATLQQLQLNQLTALANSSGGSATAALQSQQLTVLNSINSNLEVDPSTGAKQTAQQVTLDSIANTESLINAKTPPLGQSTVLLSTPVVLPLSQVISLTPPSNTGYSTTALQTAGNTLLASIDSKISVITAPTVPAFNASAITVSAKSAAGVVIGNSGTNVSTYTIPTNGRIRALNFTNTSTTTLFIQIHSSAVALTSGVTPLGNGLHLLIPPSSSLIEGPSTFGENGRLLFADMIVAISTTPFTYTQPSAAVLNLCGLHIEYTT